MLCRKQIEQSLKWGDSEAWSNDDFEHLSEKIFDKTRVQLSISTLKRIWGKVRYENFPTTGTLNALAGFLGYESWREFRQENEVVGPVVEVNEPVIVRPPEISTEPVQPVKPKQRTAPKLISIAAVLVVVAVFFLIREKKAKPVVDLSKVKFEAIKVSDSLPNSVIFNYDASAFKSDSVYIQQSWDPTRREKVDGNGHQHTSIYYNPGYFLAKLVVDNKIVKQCIVNIQTKGWKGTIEKMPVPIYLSAKEIKGDGFMGVSAATLQQKTGSPVFNGVAVKFANVQDFKNINADNFTFETTLRNSSAVEASVCRQVNAVILGSGSAIVIPLVEKGCISQIGILAAGNFIDGKNHDLSAFGCDFSKFQDLKCTVNGKSLKIYLDDKIILATTVGNSLHEIVGIRFEFEGAGEVKNVTLSTPGRGSYHDSF